MIVEVKQEHIDEGTQGCPCYCAVSLAVYNALEDKYNFSPIRLGDRDNMNEAVETDESWIETNVAGYGVEISIYTKLADDVIVEDYIELDNDSQEYLGKYSIEDWIGDFDIGREYVSPVVFKIEDIHRMNNKKGKE
tara:strand:+ start:311 stop:718 length:408 start_codon:yes stop_codon:yes gene_type:complete